MPANSATMISPVSLRSERVIDIARNRYRHPAGTAIDIAGIRKLSEDQLSGVISCDLEHDDYVQILKSKGMIPGASG